MKTVTITIPDRIFGAEITITTKPLPADLADRWAAEANTLGLPCVLADATGGAR